MMVALADEQPLLEHDGPLLSVVVPMFNEAATIERTLDGIANSPVEKQIIIIDDASSDGAGELAAQWCHGRGARVVRHAFNRGKSRAIRTGLLLATGTFTLVQDADLEYDPADYSALLAPLLDDQADLVLGSRYLNAKHRDAGLWFRAGVGALNLAVRLLYGVRLTDEATCYKAIRTETLRQMDLQCERFEFCPEVIAKACRMGLRIVEVPISYHPRTKKQGKKIRLRDGISALWTLWRWRKWEPGKKPEARSQKPAEERSGFRVRGSAGDTQIAIRNTPAVGLSKPQLIPLLSVQHSALNIPAPAVSPQSSVLSPKPAFTLVELLVVIGIITLLIAVLLPAVVRAQQNADRVNCLARLHQIGFAAQLHQSDHRGYLPAGGWQFATAEQAPKPAHIATPEGLHDSAEQHYIYYVDAGQKRPVPVTVALGKYMQVPVDLGSREGLTRTLNAEPIKHLFICPAQSPKQLLSGLTQRDDADGWTAPVEFSSYVFNEAALGRRTAADNGGNEPPVGNATRIRQSATVMFAADGRPRNQDTDNWLMVFDKGPQDTLYDFQQHLFEGGWGKQIFDHERHQGIMNVLFVDGHVESVRMTPGELKAVGVSKGIYEVQ